MYKERFATLLSETMDSTHIFGEHSLFAYGITDGVLDEMTEEQRSAIIRVIESFLKEHKSADSERKHTPKVSK
jgi:hypothetical protein